MKTKKSQLKVILRINGESSSPKCELNGKEGVNGRRIYYDQLIALLKKDWPQFNEYDEIEGGLPSKHISIRVEMYGYKAVAKTGNSVSKERRNARFNALVEQISPAFDVINESVQSDIDDFDRERREKESKTTNKGKRK